MTNPLKTMSIESDSVENMNFFLFLKKKTKRTINLKSIREREKKNFIQRILKLHSRNHNNEWFLVLLYHHTGL